MKTFAEIIDSPIPVLLVFYADWHSLSKEIREQTQQIANQWEGKIKILKIDTDKNQEICQALQIDNSPTYFIYKEKEEIWRGNIFLSTEEIEQEIQKIIKTS